MMTSLTSPISRRVFDTAELVSEFPPRFSHPNKQTVHRIACPPGFAHSGRIIFSRWGKIPLASVYESGGEGTAFSAREDYFGYEISPGDGSVVEWYLNFAHNQLFGFYGGALFAQDEMQVAEHPALGSLREALLKSDIAPLTVERGEPTPILIMGVERRCRVAIDRNAALGRPHGLYGNHFAQASAAAVERATQVISPPTITNLIAIEAPACGSGRYSSQEIEYVLSTAFGAYSAARLESHHDGQHFPEVVIHTGFWGCGAYGGNQILMALLQLIAARLARIDRLVFHTGNGTGAQAYRQAVELLGRLTPSDATFVTVPDLIANIESLGMRWGISDGN